ncbi:MAG: HNH endonuclease [Gemmatimonadetes bacterium]|nr:HNH endonuclease [Gemmatimonadota bacterium]
MDPARVDAVADEIRTLSAHIHAATHRLLTLIAEFDRFKGWEREGHRSCAHWLAFNTGIDLGAAREKVRAARALGDLPETSAAMARGALSFAKVRALTRVATARNEGDLLELARGSTAADLERMVRGWRLASAKDEAELERIRHLARTLSVFPGDDGMYVIRGRVDPEVGILLMRAVEAASDALYRRGCVGGAMEDVTPEQRRADALGLMAERAMDAVVDVSAETSTSAPADPAGGDSALAHPSPASVPISGSRAQRYQVLLHVDVATLGRNGDAGTPARGAGEPGGVGRTGNTNATGSDAVSRASEPCAVPRTTGLGRSELEDGVRVSAETSRRLACDASMVEVRHRADGKILDIGRRTRTIPPAIRRALEIRDRGCVFPGCGLRFTDAHHVVHWADGGATKLENLALVCRHHHRLLHEEGYRLELNPWEGGRPVFYDPRGVPVPDVVPVTEVGPRAVEALMGANRRRGVRPDWRTATCRWEREDDIPSDVLERAEDAA